MFLTMMLFLYSSVNVYAQDPQTTLSVSGILGTDGWYKSSVTVDFLVESFGSAPASLVYKIDNQDARTVQYARSTLLPVNGSFETFSTGIPSGWGVSDSAYTFPSLVLFHSGNRSVGLVSYPQTASFTYLSNKQSPTLVTEGETIDVSAWAMQYISQDSLAYFEVHGLDGTKTYDQVLGFSNYVAEQNQQWSQFTSSVVVPSGVQYVYLAMGVYSSSSSISYWDDVRILTQDSKKQSIAIPLTSEGQTQLTYYSIDDLGRQEQPKQEIIKKDSKTPNPPSSIVTSEGACVGCFDSKITVSDLESGLLVSNAQYRYYSKQSGLLWSDWQPVLSAIIFDSGLEAYDGVTQPVTISTGEISYGDPSQGPFRVQFSVGDVAGAFTKSPVFGLFNPWVNVGDSPVYSSGPVSIYEPSDQTLLTLGSVISSDAINAFPSTGTRVENYQHTMSNASSLVDIIPGYGLLASNAAPCPSTLPHTNGTCVYASDLTVSSSTISHEYVSVPHSSVIIVKGDLTITDNIPDVASVATVFIVEGDVSVSGAVTQISGLFIVGGTFSSDINETATQPLMVYGSVVSISGVSLSRDLGIVGANSNETTPAEVFVWQPKYLFDDHIISSLRGEKASYVWREVE